MLLPCSLNLIGAITCSAGLIHGWACPFARDAMWIVKSALWVLTATYLIFALLWAALPDSTGVTNPLQTALPSVMAVSMGSALALAYAVKEKHMPDIFLILGVEVLLAQGLDLLLLAGAAPAPHRAALAALAPAALLFAGAACKLSARAGLARRQTRSQPRRRDDA